MSSDSSITNSSHANKLISTTQKFPLALGIKLFREAMLEAKKIPNVLQRASILLELAQQLPNELFDELIVATQELPHDLYRVLIYRTIAERSLPSKRLIEYARAISSISEIKDKNQREAQLNQILQKLPHKLFENILEYIKQHPDINTQAKTSISIADGSHQDQETEIFSDLLDYVGEIYDENERLELLSSTIELLPNSQIDKALSITRAIQDSSDKARGLLILAEHFQISIPDSMFTSLCTEFLSTLKNIRDKKIIASLLKEATRIISSNLIKDVLMILSELPNDYDRYDVLIKLSQRMRGEQLYDFLAIANSITNERYRILALAAIIRHSPKEKRGDLLSQILREVQQIQDKFTSADLLITSSTGLTEDEQLNLLQVAIMLARAMQDEKTRIRLLSRLPQNLLTPDEVKVVIAQPDMAAKHIWLRNYDDSSTDSPAPARMAGDTTTDAPPPKGKKKKKPK
jgi:hypothetical protein